ncbi:hypothetical protein KM043_013990 [Ampulex compressa]|nr:hypothetical protein KM043_013990 [Ampulex compressa]
MGRTRNVYRRLSCTSSTRWQMDHSLSFLEISSKLTGTWKPCPGSSQQSLGVFLCTECSFRVTTGGLWESASVPWVHSMAGRGSEGLTPRAPGA